MEPNLNEDMLLDEEEASEYPLDPSIMPALVQQESRGRSWVTSPAGAKGLTQLMDATGEAQFQKLNLSEKYDSYDPYNPEQNLEIGTAELQDLNNKYKGDTDLALAAYNYGQGNVDRLIKKYGNSFSDIEPHLPEETRQYVPGVRSFQGKTSTAATKRLPQIDTEEYEGNPAGLAKALMPLISSPDFQDASLSEKAQAIKSVYDSKYWGPEGSKVIKEVITDYIDAAPSDEQPDYSEIVGTPPFLEPGQDNDKAIRSWKENVTQSLIKEGINPAFLGKQLDLKIDEAVAREQDAFTARNRSTAGWIANQGANLARDTLKGVVSGFAKPIAGITRLAGASEAADTIQDIPEYLGKPANDYLYETDENGYLKLNPDNTPIPRWQGQAAQMVGQVGSFIAGGVALKAAGYGALAIEGSLFGVNTLTAANDIFKTVYDQTKGDTEKAYTASLFALPAAAIGSLGQLAVVSKWANPALSELSGFNKAKYLANIFARNAVVGGTANLGMDVIMQAGEISQTGQPFDSGRAYVALGAGGLISGGIAGVTSLGARPKASEVPTRNTNTEAPTKLPATEKTLPETPAPVDALEVVRHQGTIAEQQKMVSELEKFQQSDAVELVVTSEQLKSIPENILPIYGLETADNGEMATLTKRSTYTPADAEGLAEIDNLIGKINKSLEFDGTPSSVEGLVKERQRLTRKIALDTESVNRATVELAKERGKLAKELEARRAILDEQTDPILKKVAYAELQDAEATLQKFDTDNADAFSLHERIGDTQNRIDTIDEKIKNFSRDTYVNDIKAKERNLKQLLRKRKAILKEAQQRAIEEEKAANAKASPEGKAPKKEVSIPGAKDKGLDEIAEIEKPKVDFSEGVKAGDNYVLPVGSKWYKFNNNGELLGKGYDYYGDAIRGEPARATEATAAPSQARTDQAPPRGDNSRNNIVPEVSEPPVESTVGAQFVEAKERKTGERLRLGTRLSNTVREGFSGNNELTYFPQSHEKTSALARSFIEYHGGFENAVHELLSRPDTYTSAENTAATQYVMESLHAAELKAVKAGDTKAADSYAALQIELGNKRAATATNTAQALEAAKMWKDFDPSTFIRGTKKSLRDIATENYAKKKGVPVDQVVEKEARLNSTKKRIAETEKSPESKERDARLRKLKAEEESILADLSDLKRSQDEAEAKLTAEDQATIKQLFKASQETGGSLQQNILAQAFDIQAKAERLAGKPNPMALYSLWMANLLSDLSTQVVNILGNTSALMGSAASFFTTGIAKGRFDVRAMLQGFVDGATREGFDSAMLELQGIRTYRPTSDKFIKIANSAKREDFVTNAPQWMKKIGLNKMGYVFRALSAADAFFYKTSQEGMAKFAALNEGLGKGLKGKELQTYVADTLFNSTAEWDNALLQARREANAAKEAQAFPVSDRLIRQRAWEILEAKRPESIRTESMNFASRNTFSNKPEGLVGTVVESIQKVAGWKGEIPYFGTEVQPFRYFFPFMNVAGNLLNASLDYTVVGGLRALNKSDISSLERRNIFGKFILGSAVSAGIYSLAKEFLDDKDPKFAIYGSGPTNAAERTQWLASGGRPFSIKYGDSYYRYVETPLVSVLGGMGAIFDEMRYNKNFDKASGIEAISILLGGTGEAFVNNSFLKSIGGFYNAIQGKDINGNDSKTALTDVLVANPLRGFVPAAGALHGISALVDNPIDTKESFYAKLISQTPFVQNIGTRPALNAFGEPVERTWEDRLRAVGRFYSERVEDPEWRFLAGKGYKLPDFGVTVSGLTKKQEEKRSAEHGAIFADVLTPDERYLLIERAGPLIKAKVSEYRKRYGNVEFSEAVQEKLVSDVKAIRSKVRRDIALGR